MIGRTILDAAARRIDPYVGTSIWDRGDWDICCILDGCRVDTCRRYDPDADAVWSVASTSQDWLPRTFGDRDCSRVAYITGNPYADRLDSDRFATFRTVPVTDCEGVETVHPRTITHDAIADWRRREQRGIERMVIHYMQPHVPFPGYGEWFAQYRGTDTWGSHIWKDVGTDIDRTDWMDAYRQTFYWAMAWVLELAGNADATIAITADHGNAAGEWGYAGHPQGCLHPAVRQVPWTTLAGSDAGTITVEPPDTRTAYDPAAQREALGYA